MVSKSPPQALWSTSRAARALGVGSSTVQRWADDGKLPSVRTVGGHRRFREGDVLALRQSLDPGGGTAELWADLLVGEDDPYRLQAALLGARARSGAWAPVADEIGAGLEELGRRWESNDCSVFEEHLASERLVRALVRCGELMPVRVDAPGCLLLAPAGEEHTLGLSLVELVSRDSGWRCTWLGRRTPLREVERAIDALSPSLIAVSASSYCADAADLRQQYDELSDVCRRRRVDLIVGGRGAWPSATDYGARLRSLQELPAILQAVERSHRGRRPHPALIGLTPAAERDSC